MRHNQNGRRFRGRGNGQSHQGGGGHHNHGNHGNNGQGRRVNPRVQTFDSNGPEVRIRGNAYQINEKYLTLAKDAAAGSDRVLAESYLQHAEHYQRMINEMTEEYNRHMPQHQQHQQPVDVSAEGAEQPVVDAGMPDLDQGFLVGPRNGAAQPAPEAEAEAEAEGDVQVQPSPRARQAAAARAKQAENA